MGGGVRSGGGGVGLGGGQGRCNKNVKFLLKFKKKIVGGLVRGGGVRVGWGFRVDVNEELKFL